MPKCTAVYSKIFFNLPVARENKRKRKWGRKKRGKKWREDSIIEIKLTI